MSKGSDETDYARWVLENPSKAHIARTKVLNTQRVKDLTRREKFGDTLTSYLASHELKSVTILNKETLGNSKKFYPVTEFYRVFPYEKLCTLFSQCIIDTDKNYYTILDNCMKVCDICGEEFLQTENIAMLYCFHIFHIKCINKCIEKDFKKLYHHLSSRTGKGIDINIFKFKIDCPSKQDQSEQRSDLNVYAHNTCYAGTIHKKFYVCLDGLFNYYKTSFTKDEAILYHKELLPMEWIVPNESFGKKPLTNEDIGLDGNKTLPNNLPQGAKYNYDTYKSKLKKVMDFLGMCSIERVDSVNDENILLSLFNAFSKPAILVTYEEQKLIIPDIIDGIVIQPHLSEYGKLLLLLYVPNIVETILSIKSDKSDKFEMFFYIDIIRLNRGIGNFYKLYKSSDVIFIDPVQVKFEEDEIRGLNIIIERNRNQINTYFHAKSPKPKKSSKKQRKIKNKSKTRSRSPKNRIAY